MTIHGLAASLSSLTLRSVDGVGNNIGNPTWGAAGDVYVRVTDNVYGSDDGNSWDLPESAGGTLPDALEVVDTLFDENPRVENSFGSNEYAQFFGQFVAHDIAQAKGGIPGVSEPLLDGGTFPTTRDAYIIDDDGVRQTVTKTTAYVDLSQVYGKSDTVLSLLREPDSARLIMSETNLLPTIRQVAEIHGEDPDALMPLFLVVPITPDLPATGDERAFQTPQLLSMHTVWARNHNWHVEQLSETYPDWTADQIFNAARALNEAEYQQVVFGEYVPTLHSVEEIGDYTGYDSQTNAAIINEWTTVGNRFGHDQASDTITGLDEAGEETFSITLSEAIASGATSIFTEDDLSNWIRGQLAQSSEEIDGKIAKSIGELTVLPGVTLNLKAMDVARGRDHGVNDYNALRAGLGLETYADFDAFAADNDIDDVVLQKLKDIYDDDISKLDSQIGGLLEKDVEGSQFGETFTTLSITQYKNLRDGDRFYYEERFKDNPELIAAIKATSLSDILARNSDIDYLYRDAFAAHDRVGGTEEKDFLRGSNDADLIIGNGGNDILIGANGADDLYGGDGRDSLYGGSGDDLMVGGDGRDYLNGGRGMDVIRGGADNDKILGSYGNDLIDGGDGDDRIYGGYDNDMVIGGSGNDWLFGGKGNDLVEGGEGRDWLFGSVGDDTLSGGAGTDSLWGGAGEDVYVFEADTGYDRVFGFRAGEDKLDLSAYGFETIEDVRDAASTSFWFFGFRSRLELDDDNGIVFYGFNANRLTEDDVIL